MDTNIQSGPIQIRPRYRRETTAIESTIIHEIIEGLRQDEWVAGSTLKNHAYLKIPEKNQHYWSPEFHVTLEKLDDGTLVRGVIGPKPKVWTMFMFFYSAIWVLLFLGIAIGVSQWSIGMKPDWLWSVPACLFMWVATIAAAKYGQHKAKRQTHTLWKFLDHAVERAEVQQ